MSAPKGHISHEKPADDARKPDEQGATSKPLTYREKYKAFCDTFHPVPVLQREDVPKGTEFFDPKYNDQLTREQLHSLLYGPDPEFSPMEGGPLLRYYGWVFTENWVIKWARDINLTVLIQAEYLVRHPELISDDEQFELASFPDDSPLFTDPDLRGIVSALARWRVVRHISELVVLSLDIEIPIAYGYKQMVVFCTNYTVARRLWLVGSMGDECDIMESLDRYMAEPGEESKEGLWYFAADNPIYVGMRAPGKASMTTMPPGASVC
ncbi:uncharacterized protein BXZ73DRAFT_105708 [Epithele typhae]|uniref:uncharacterized protein n=1 Tax=Epithele typhae TaxID=378194 RepID=UPI00200758A5|nr:uncharacterized protein BXZ73DRAFT_105708 [Epithele typhae]KAH9916730.1 hypothetical protein BXZ73DRAFT_105708 [Epithele typhae]